MNVNNSSFARTEKRLLSRVFEVETLGDNELEVAFPLDAEERQTLCQCFDLIALEDWEATAWLRRTADQAGIVLRVTFAANVIQSCVVTLEPVPSRVQQSFTIQYLPEDRIDGAEEGDDAELVVDVEGEDSPEILEEGGVDVGEAIAEQFALALDPYPRTPGVEFQFGMNEESASEDNQIQGENPFAALKSWQAGS